MAQVSLRKVVKKYDDTEAVRGIVDGDQREVGAEHDLRGRHHAAVARSWRWEGTQIPQLGSCRRDSRECVDGAA